MDARLTNYIYTALTASNTSLAKKVYYEFVPDKDLEHLKKYCIVFEVENTGNQDTLDAKEIAKQFELSVKSTSTNLQTLAENTDTMKGTVYRLQGDTFKYIGLITDNTFFDADLNVWTEYLRFSISV